jgi:polyisoprenoid-binding protein YceI
MTTEVQTRTTTWTADPMHSIAEFAVKHLVVTTAKGRFRDLEATLHIDEANPENSWAEAKIPVASVQKEE